MFLRSYNFFNFRENSTQKICEFFLFGKFMGNFFLGKVGCVAMIIKNEAGSYAQL